MIVLGLFLTSNNSYAKIVTLSKCFYIAHDVERFKKWTNILKDIYSPAPKFQSEIFEAKNIYINLKNYDLSYYRKYKKKFYSLYESGLKGHKIERLYHVFSKEKTFIVEMDKQNYVLTYTRYFNDPKGYFFKNKKDWDDKLKNAGYKWNDPSRIIKADLLSGVVTDNMYNFSGLVQDIHQCTALSENQIKNSPSEAYHFYIKDNSYFDGQDYLERPKLYYDKFTGGMRECSHDPGVTGNCVSFKQFNSSVYDKDTLFYNPKSGTMQPCIGKVSFNGKCSLHGIYKAGTSSKDQLFYNSKTKTMSTCNFIGINGKCESFDIIPKRGSTGGSYIVDSKVNPYLKTVPMNSSQLINLGLNMLSGGCTLGLNC